MMRFAAFTLVTLIGMGSAFAEISANDVKIVNGEIATSLTGVAGDSAKGALAFKGRKLGNCLACHANSDMKSEQFHGEVGPVMDGVGDRYTEAQLRAIVVNSKAVFGDQTIMPAFYRTDGFNRVPKKFEGKPILNAQQVEDVVAYLRTLK